MTEPTGLTPPKWVGRANQIEQQARYQQATQHLNELGCTITAEELHWILHHV